MIIRILIQNHDKSVVRLYNIVVITIWILRNKLYVKKCWLILWCYGCLTYIPNIGVKLDAPKKFNNHSKDNDTIKCEDCGVNVSNVQSLKIHKNTEHAKQKHDNFICKVCSHKFMNEVELKNHWDKISFNCKGCSHKFMNEVELRNHWDETYWSLRALSHSKVY